MTVEEELPTIETTSLAERIRNFCEREEIPIQDFSARAGITNGDLYRIMNAKRPPSKVMRERIDAVLGGRLVVQAALDPTAEKLMSSVVNLAKSHDRLAGIVGTAFRRLIAEEGEEGAQRIALSILRQCASAIKDENGRFQMLMDLYNTVNQAKPRA